MINLPLKDKNTPVEITTVWKEDVAVTEGEGWKATILAGTLNGITAKVPHSTSWAADPAHHVRIFKLDMEPGAKFLLEPCEAGTRNVYITETGAKVAGKEYPAGTRLKMRPDMEAEIEMLSEPSEVWILEGDPIGEKQCQWGPVVLGTDAEVRKANNEVREKEMEHWDWEYVNQKQPLGTPRFYRAADGTESRPKETEPGE